VVVHDLRERIAGRLGLGQNGCGDGEEKQKDVAHGNGDRVLPLVWQGVSGGRYAISLDDVIAHIKALNAHPFFHKIDGHAQQDQAVSAANIALEQETGGIAHEPPGFIHTSANFHHLFSL